MGLVKFLGFVFGGPIISGTAGNAAESFTDNVIKDKVRSLSPGTVLYCDLPIGEHSGIYIGDNQIVHLNGDGDIESVSPKKFLDRLGGNNVFAISIYASCNHNIYITGVGSSFAAERAKKMIGSRRDYNFLFDGPVNSSV
jgi:cell wall-associated NlpC family hydrolase